jgi:uncharacterized protein (DUF885 family)
MYRQTLAGFQGGRTRALLACGVIVLACAALLAGRDALAQATGSAHDRLVSLARDMTFTTASLFPEEATFLGIKGHDGELETPSEAYRAAFLSRLLGWQEQLKAIAAGFDDKTPLADRDDAKLLAAQLESQLDALRLYQEDRKDYSRPSTGLVNTLFTQFQHLPVVGQEGATRADLLKAWADIVSRMQKGPAYIEASQRLVTMPGHLYGVTGVKQLAGAPEFLTGPLTDAATQQLGKGSALFTRFVHARDALVASLKQSKAYIDAHVQSWPENFAMGKGAYDHMLREEQLLPYSAADIERMGRDELAHGWAEEAWVMSLAKQQSVPFGARTGGGMAPSGPALIDYYRERIADLRKFVTEQDLVTVPAWLGSMEVTATPSFLQPVSPGASMNPPLPFAESTTGYYYITPPKSLEEAAARLDMNEDFDRDRILSTAAHEAMPGHFLQLSIAKRHPDFVRKIQQSGAFAEGWAFYGEEMFVRLGLFGNDLDARLFVARWERVRGARAIVDPRLASGEWTYSQAVDFFTAQTGFTREDAEAAVAAIATGPGYVIAYTAGRAQLEELLAEYQLKMGAAGSLHDFHDRLLSYGTVPFSIVGPELMADLAKPAAEVRKGANY